MTLRRVPVNGVHLAVVEEGAGNPVIFGHGYLFDHTMYDAQAADLVRDHRVVRLDWRGHGGSDLPDVPWTMADQGRDYLRVLDALGIDRAVLVGQSMGGMAALHAALKAPARVAGLVLIDTSASAEPLLKRLMYGGLVWGVRLLGMRPWLLRRTAAVSFSRAFRRARPEVVARWTERWRRLDPGWVARTVGVPVRRPSVAHRLGAIRAPALVIYGDRDRTTPFRESRLLAERLPDARLRIVRGAGHMTPIERPADVATMIRDFLEEIRW